jgi:hypothetical protein
VIYSKLQNYYMKFAKSVKRAYLPESAKNWLLLSHKKIITVFVENQFMLSQINDSFVTYFSQIISFNFKVSHCWYFFNHYYENMAFKKSFRPPIFHQKLLTQMPATEETQRTGTLNLPTKMFKMLGQQFCNIVFICFINFPICF